MPSTPDDDRFRQRHQVPRRVELSDHDLPAEKCEIGHELVRIDGRLDGQQQVRTAYLVGNGCSPGHSTSRSRSGRIYSVVFAAARAPRRLLGGAVDRGRRWRCSHRSNKHPNSGRPRAVAMPEGNLGRLPELRVPSRCAPLVADQRSGGRETRPGHLRGGVRGHSRGINCHLEAAALQLPRRSQPRRPASEHGGLAVVVLQRQVCRHCTATPRQRPARAAESVVIDDCLLVEFFPLQDETGIAMWSQTDGGSNHALL